MSEKTNCRIGVISDTHGLLRPEAISALQGSDLIIHAGDIGTKAILDRLHTIAPVLAVRGNNDTGPWAENIPATRIETIGGVTVQILHDAKELVAPCARCRVVISGHSHRPCIIERHGLLFMNPGSAGPRRFSLPVSVARLDVHGDTFSARLIELDVPRSQARGMGGGACAG
ncbi:MAG: metallophosphoesterase family protein [Nitrospiraceae bacterium]